MSVADYQRTDRRDHAAGRPQRWCVYHADAEPSGNQGMEVRVGSHGWPPFWMEKGIGERPVHKCTAPRWRVPGVRPCGRLLLRREEKSWGMRRGDRSVRKELGRSAHGGDGSAWKPWGRALQGRGTYNTKSAPQYPDFRVKWCASSLLVASPSGFEPLLTAWKAVFLSSY